MTEAVTEASEKLKHAAAAAKEKLGGAGTALSVRGLRHLALSPPAASRGAGE